MTDDCCKAFRTTTPIVVDCRSGMIGFSNTGENLSPFLEMKRSSKWKYTSSFGEER
jgi:hypothetical protein